MKIACEGNRGLTLIELLVIVAIVAFVVGLILPLPAAKEKERKVQCMNNLKQIGLSCAQYAVDFRGRLPCGKSSVFANMGLTTGYITSPKVLVCPQGRKTAASSFSMLNASDAVNVDYTYQVGMTNSLVWQEDANHVVMWDQGVQGNPYGINGGIGLSWATNSNHKGAGGNVLFLDGRVEWETKTPTNMTLGCQNP